MKRKMGKEIIEMLVDGGKAKADASVAQKLGPMKINIQNVLNKINEKTESFNGMKVPVKLTVDKDTKEFEVSIGTPPIAELIKKEFNLKKGSSFPDKDKVANISIEQAIKIAKMKESSILHNSLKSVVKTVIGSCNAMGILVEGKTASEINRDIDNGKYTKEINEVSTKTPEDKKERLQDELAQYNKQFLGDIEKLKAKLKKEEKKEEKTEAPPVKK